MKTAERHVVLVAPDVHWNTGNIGRTCLGAGAALHLIHPLGFSLDDKHLKRAGLDYWPAVDLRVWNDFEAFCRGMAPKNGEVALLTKNGRTPFWQMPHTDRMFLVFGSETRGLPESVRRRYPESDYHIPIHDEIRSLNLSTAAGIVLYESLRNCPPVHGYADDH